MIPDLSLAALRQSYASGETTPEEVMAGIRQRSAEYADHNIWIHLLDENDEILDGLLKQLKERD